MAHAFRDDSVDPVLVEMEARAARNRLDPDRRARFEAIAAQRRANPKPRLVSAEDRYKRYQA